MAASNLVNLVATGLAMADVSQTNRWREEDLIQRKLENTRRDIDEKVEGLRAISQLAALIAGFDIVVLIELDVPTDIPEVFLILLGLTSAMTVCLMSLSFVLCTLMLVGILKAFDINSNRRQTFREFWILRCESDWRKAFKYFTYGVPCFMSNLAVAAWVKFFFQSQWTAVVVTVVVVVGVINWLRLHQKWGSFLAEKSAIPKPAEYSRFNNTTTTANASSTNNNGDAGATQSNSGSTGAQDVQINSADSMKFDFDHMAIQDHKKDAGNQV